MSRLNVKSSGNIPYWTCTHKMFCIIMSIDRLPCEKKDRNTTTTQLLIPIASKSHSNTTPITTSEALLSEHTLFYLAPKHYFGKFSDSLSLQLTNEQYTCWAEMSNSLKVHLGGQVRICDCSDCLITAAVRPHFLYY